MHDEPADAFLRLIERAIALSESGYIELDDLPPAVRGDYAATLMPSVERDDTMRAWGSRYAQLVVARCKGNKRQACRTLGISYHTLQAYLRYTPDGATATETAGWMEQESEANASV